MTPADLRELREAARDRVVVNENPLGTWYANTVYRGDTTELHALAPDLALALADAWEALERIAGKPGEKLLYSMKPGGEWTERHEVYENIARAVLAKLEGLGA